MKIHQMQAGNFFSNPHHRSEAIACLSEFVLRNWLIASVPAGLMVAASVRNRSAIEFFGFVLVAIFLFVTIVRRLSNSLSSYARVEFGNFRMDRSELSTLPYSQSRKSGQNLMKVGAEISCNAGSVVPADGIIIFGLALMDESAITGESAPVLRDVEDQRNLVHEGTTVLTNEIKIRITRLPQQGQLAKINRLLRDPEERLRVNQLPAEGSFIFRAVARYIGILLLVISVGLGMIWPLNFLLAMIFLTVVLAPMWGLSVLQRELNKAFIDLSVHRKLLPDSIQTIERAGRVQTIAISEIASTAINSVQIVKALLPAPNVSIEQLAKAAQIAYLCDETGRGRAVVTFIKSKFGFLAQSLSNKRISVLPTNSQEIMGMNISGDDDLGMRSILAGNLASIRRHVESLGSFVPENIQLECDRISASGEAAMIVCDGKTILGLVHFFDSENSAVASLFSTLTKYGFEITTIATEDQLDPYNFDSERKVIQLKILQTEGKRVAYIGQYASDRAALFQSDLRLVAAMDTEALTHLSEAANLNGNPSQFKHLFRLGKELNEHRRYFSHLGTSIFLLSAGVLAYQFDYLTTADWVSHLAQLRRQSLTPLISYVLAVLICGIIVMQGLIGLHDRRGKLYQLSEQIFLGWRGVLSLLLLIISATALLQILAKTVL